MLAEEEAPHLQVRHPMLACPAGRGQEKEDAAHAQCGPRHSLGHALLA